MALKDGISAVGQTAWRRPALAWAGLLVASPIAAFTGGLPTAYTVTIAALFSLGLSVFSAPVPGRVGQARSASSGNKALIGALIAFWLVACAGLFTGPAVKLWPPEALKGETSAIVIGLGLPLFSILVARIWRFSASEHDLVSRGALASVLAMGLIFAAEVLSNQAWVRMHAPALPTDATELTRAYREELLDGAMARGSTALCLWVFPVAALFWARSWPLRVLLALAWGTAFAAGIDSDNAALSIALIAGAAVGGLGAAFPRLMSLLSLVFIGITALAAPVLAGFAARMIDSGASAALPYSWEVRAYIWRETLGQILLKPVFGHGIEAGREFEGTFELRGYTFEAISHHPHNFALHLWHDLGAVGAALFALVFFALAAKVWGVVPTLGSRRRAAGAALCGAAASAWTVASLSYGIWQEWWLATLAVLVGLVVLAFCGKAGAEHA